MHVCSTGKYSVIDNLQPIIAHCCLTNCMEPWAMFTLCSVQRARRYVLICFWTDTLGHIWGWWIGLPNWGNCRNTIKRSSMCNPTLCEGIFWSTFTFLSGLKVSFGCLHECMGSYAWSKWHKSSFWAWLEGNKVWFFLLVYLVLPCFSFSASGSITPYATNQSMTWGQSILMDTTN